MFAMEPAESDPQMVRVPMSKDDPIAEMLMRDGGWVDQELKKLAFHGLPMRLKWEVLVVVLGWKLADGSKIAAPTLKAVLELGEDGHYFSLVTDAGPAASHSFGGESGSLPRLVMTSYHQRRDKLRLSLRNGDAVVGYSNFAIKDLSKGKPRVGWIKLKDESRDEKVERKRVVLRFLFILEKKGRRNHVIGSIHLGMLISPPLKAEALFLLDMQEREVLFYQETETLTDLNPVFVQPSMTPFRWTDERGLYTISTGGGTLLATVQRKLDVVNIVQPNVEPYWQCSVTAALENSFCVDGCWTGSISEQRKARGIVLYECRSGETLASHAEWRNARDLKLSVGAPEDPLIQIALMIAIMELKKK